MKTKNYLTTTCNLFFGKSTLLLAQSFAILFFIMAGINPASAQWSGTTGLPIAYWDFESNAARATLETTVEQQINTGNTFDGKFGGVSTATSRRAGAGIDVYSGTADGSALRAGGWSSSSTAGTGITTFFQFTINTTGFSGIRLNFDAFPVDGGILVAPSFGVTYSTDGGTVYTNVGSQTTFGGSWYSNNLFTLGSGANNISNLKIRIYGYWSDNSTSSTLAIDNLLFTATGLAASAGTKTTLSETGIYTSYTSGSTGSLWIRYGTFTVNSGATLNMGSQIFLGSASTAGAISVLSGGTFDCGSSASQTLSTVASGLSTFTLASGATINIRSTAGIVAAGTNSGNIQVTTRTFNSAADYVYTHVSGTAMNTGTGLPAAFTSGGSVRINNTNAVTLTQATAFGTGSTLLLTTGTFTIGALLTMNNGSTIDRDIGTLSAVPTFSPTVNVTYSGTNAVNTANELPSGASNLGALTINKTGGVTLITSAIVNGLTTLTAGSLNIASNTLTLNGAITNSGGTIGGTTASNLTIAGSGAITGNLSFTTGAQQLNNLTNSRAASTVTLGTALSIGGNISNSATINATAATTFNQAGSVTVSGSGTTNFTTVVLAKSVKADEVNCTGLVTMSTGGLGTIGTGTFKLSSASTIVPFSGTTTVPSTAAFTLNHASAISNYGTNASMTMNGDLNIINGTMTIGGATGNSLTIGSTGTMTMNAGTLNLASRISNSGGSFTMSGGTIILNKNGNASATATFNATAAANINISNGSIIFQDVNTGSGNDITITSGAGTKTFSGGTIQFGNAATGAGLTYRCNSPVSFNHVTINATNAPSLSLITNNLNVNGTLALNGGNISTAALRVVIAATGNVTRTNGHVFGNLQKNFNTGTGLSKTFEVGDATVYAPVQLASLNVSTAGNVTAFTAAGTNPSENIPVSNSSGINQAARANRYWTMTAAGGFAMSNANATFNFSAGEATGSTANYVVRKYDPSAWAITTTGIRTSTSTQCTGLTSFSEFEVGETTAVPGITCPADITQCDNAVVTFTPVVSGSPVPDILCTPASGSTFSLGTTLVSCTATNINGSAGCSFNVTINTTPVIGACPADIIQCDNYVATYSTPSATATPSASVSCSPVSGSTFAAGVNSVTCTATNACGNSSCSFNVTINETPVISACPSDITQCDNYMATWINPSASGTPAASIVCAPASGSVFAAGTTPVTCTASNSCGSSSCSFNVTINETPVIGACPADITSCNAVVTFSTPSSTGTPVASVTCSPVSGSTFAIGTTPVTCTATNSCGSSSCSFNVEIQTSSTPATSATSNALYGQICSPGTVTLTANGGSLGTGADWVWYDGGCAVGAPVGTGVSITITPSLGMHNYSVRAEGACGPTACQSVAVNVINVPPTNTVHYTASIPDGCVASPAAAFSVNSVANCTFYNWSSSTAGVRFNGNPGPYQTTVPTVNVSFVSLPAAGTSGWSICVFGGNACGNTNTVCTWVRATLSAPTGITGSITGCPNTMSQPYSAATVAGALSYQWGATGGIVINGNGSQNITVDFPAGFISGTLSVHGQNSCGYNGPNKNISINRAPAIPGSISGTSYPCPNASTIYSVTAVPGASDYTWTTSVPGAVVTGTTNSCSILFPTVIPGGSSVSVTANSSCPFSSPLRSKGIASGLPSVPASISGPAGGQCGQTGVSYSIQPIALASGYNWNSTCGTIVGPTNLSAISIDWPGSFNVCTLSVSASNACGTGTARILAVTGAPAIPPAITGNSAPCAGAVEAYSTTGSSGATSYIWTVPAGASILGPVNGASILLQWGAASGNITVRASNACGNSGLRTLACVISCREGQVTSSTGIFNPEVYPNPATGSATLKFIGQTEGPFSIVMTDIPGKIVLSADGNATEGVNLVELNLNGIAKGIYLVSVQNNMRVEQLKIVVE